MKMAKMFTLMLVAVGLVSMASEAWGRQGPWSKEKAWAWHNAQPWLRGCNYMPASAANRVDQWQSYGSDARFVEVEREFALAQQVGFNAMRLIIEWQGFAVWLQERDAFRANFARYLDLMEKYGLRAVVCLGNDCSRPKRVTKLPKLGEQTYDLGYHGGRRVSQHGGFPGEKGYIPTDDPKYREQFFAFCRELMTKYAHDRRVAIWELWNEPGNGNRNEMSLPVIRDLFKLGWEIDPDQPIAADLWNPTTLNLICGKAPDAIGAEMADLSDIIIYHGYHTVKEQAKICDELTKRWGRPLYNTEWLLRPLGCTFDDNYAFFQQRKIGAFNWGFVNGKYQTHEPYEYMWKSQFECSLGNRTSEWFHDLFRISHHPYDPYEIAVARWINSQADGSETLRPQLAKEVKIIGEDIWYGYRRTKFKFRGHDAWIVEPSVRPLADKPWTWTMQWAEAFVERTGVLELLKRGYHHVTIDLFATRMNETGLSDAAAFQDLLVKKLGLAPKANLVGLSWGGFFSTRYAATHSERVAKIYFDAPLMNFDGFGNPDYGRIGVWANMKPADGKWTDDPRMPVNLAKPIAEAKIPVLLIYGGCDTVVPPAQNCELFAKRFKAAGGLLKVEKRGLFGHHPHGLDYPAATRRIVDFFLKN